MATPILQQALDGAPPADPTTDRVVSGALAQFEDFGIRKTTMEDVARRAGVARVTVYRRFANKERLVEAVLLGEAQRFFAELEAATARFGSVEDRIVEAFAHTLAAARGERGVPRPPRSRAQTIV